MFEPDVFIQVKNAIISTGEKYECVTDFRELDPINNSVIRESIYIIEVGHMVIFIILIILSRNIIFVI